jgi:ankyrin repeat protein
MAPSGICALPLELLVFVIENLDSVRDISALTRTNRRLYSASNPLLYRYAARHGDARPLAWAATRNLVGTLRMALAAGTDPNHEFLDALPRETWEQETAAARGGANPGTATPTGDGGANNLKDTPDDHMWDVDTDRGWTDSASDVKWSSEADRSDTDHASSPHTAQSLTISTSDYSSAHHPLSSSDGDYDMFSDEAEPSQPKPRMILRRYRAMHLAARDGHDAIVSLLADYGASLDPPSQNLCDCVPLYGLLNATEQPEDLPPLKWSPLHHALCHSRPETAKLLLSRGASYMMVPESVFASSIEREHGRGLTALHYAAGMGLSDVVRYLVDNKIQTEIDAQDEWTTTPFYYAYANRHWESTVPLLLELGANVECEIKMYIPYTAITPLGEACRLGDFEEADRLIDLGGDVKRGFIALTNGGCLTPLHMCCMRSAQPVAGARPRKRAVLSEEEFGIARMRTIEKLIAHGAQIDARDCFGSTPLMAAVQACNVPALRALLKAGAELKEHDTASRTALMQEIRAAQSLPVAAFSSHET